MIRVGMWASALKTLIASIGALIASALILESIAMSRSAAATPDYAGTMRAIAREIAALAPKFPQLSGFRASNEVGENLAIQYAYHTHRSTSRAGWGAAAPAPDSDGIWFAINFHDPDSLAQIDTQPAMPQRCFGNKRVTFLILEGKATKRVGGRLWSILEKHGVKEC